MDLLKNDHRFKLKYSENAIALLSNLDDSFPIEDFEKWVKENLFTVGDGFITAYLVKNKKASQNILKSVINKKI